jgi:SAM-dependent methyltransferase
MSGSLVENVHGSYVHTRRVRVLGEHLAAQLPDRARVLDVGCGDGLLASGILTRRPDVQIHGVDVLVRPGTHIPVLPFDGCTIPAEPGQYDVVMFVDVLHHTDDPMVLLREAARVAGQAVLIKDHTLNGLLAEPTLRFMDRVGNARHGVVLPYHYWPKQQWMQAFEELRLSVALWNTHLGLYPFPASLVFERSLHFVARLQKLA